MDSEIDLKQIWLMIWNKKWIILVVVLVFLVLGSVYTFYFVMPEYTASTTLILAKSQGDTEGTTTADVTLNDKLISTYREMAKSDKIINMVLQEYNIKDISVRELKDKISVTTVSDTQMLKISITDEDPRMAANIANALAEVFIDQVPEYFNFWNSWICYICCYNSND